MSWSGSLRARLMLSSLLIVLLALAAVNLLAWQWMLRSTFSQREETLLRQARVVAGMSGTYILKGHEFLEYIARDYGRQINARLLILDARGRVLQDSFYETGVVGADLAGRPEVIRAMAGGEAVRREPVAGIGPTAYVAVPVSAAGEVVGAVFLSQALGDAVAPLLPLRLTLLLVSLAAMALAAALAWGAASRIARPVEGLTAAAGRMSGGALRQHVPVSGRDEIARLAAAFNEMAERLHRLEESRRAFVADAAHELRTPLTALKALVEPLTSGAVTEPGAVREFLGDVEAEVDRLARLAEDLLTLSRLEHGQPLCPETVDVGELLQEVAERLQPAAGAAGVSFRVDCPAGCAVPADRPALERAVYNLAHNAVHHSPAGESIELTGRREGTEVVIQVRDRGPGIAPEELPRIFDRFHRADPARARQTGGAGLGLAIANEATRRHGGPSRWKARRDRGRRSPCACRCVRKEFRNRPVTSRSNRDNLNPLDLKCVDRTLRHVW